MADSEAIGFSKLLDWLEGRLSNEEARDVATSLEHADETAQQDLAWLRAFQRASQSVTLASPPRRVREALMHRFAEYRGARQPPGLFRRLLAELTFDSRARWAAAGVRSAASEGQHRQLVYATELAEIALNILPHEDDPRLDVTGQIFPSPDVTLAGLSVQLLQGETQVDLTAPDELGEFTFQAVPPGEYEIVVSAGEFEVVIPSCPLQP